eukprot:TRINITY_DN3801_c0_g1_i1.p1 TRINITY_DN3801_c0_g1~~TRINITY_DN3801_c0_g1_i1.p1  ORF type:complete len:552 (-),score=114.90 TRINITY_DN3801_c0_g1_i1:111-1766(-)
MADEEQVAILSSKATDGTGEKYASKVFHSITHKEIPHRWRRLLCGLFGILIACAISAGIICGLYFGFVAANSFSRYPSSISASNMVAHLEAFQEIANNHSGSRSPTTGYNASVDYVVSTLQANTDLVVSVQTFPIMYSSEPFPSALQLRQDNNTVNFVNGVDFLSIRNQGPGNVTAFIDTTPGLGCSAADYQNFTAGSIALVYRGVCTFSAKGAAATAAKAAGLLIVNYDGQGVIAASMSPPLTFPALLVSYGVGSVLQDVASTDQVTMYSSSVIYQVITSNVIADTVDGNASAIIVVGSHLDSVPAGPGINDNGSGSGANLELALNINKVAIKNRVRFCWWGAEELGLLGSTFYVNSLSTTDRANIALNINLDMIASPNYFVGVYNGRAASGVPECNNLACLNGSAVIQALFEQFFNVQNQTCDDTAFDGRSDYGPFLDANIPAGGLFTGAEAIKDATMRSRYGGLANAAFDPCYHAYCDNVDNINEEVYQQMGRASATVLETLATQSDLKGYLNKGSQQVTSNKDYAPCNSQSSATLRARRPYIDDVKL